MRVPLSWLRDYVEIKMPVEELAHGLTMAGIEVELIERIGARWEKIYVGEVLEVRPHPNADRLTIAMVNYGGDAPLTAITGAPNIKVGDRGQKVATALSGARLIDGHSPEHKEMVLKPAKLRGVHSEGMICSELELGISDSHEGIMILDDDAPVGVPLAEYLGDMVLHLKLSPNLGRCLSLIGVAREVAALTGGRARLPEANLLAEGEPIREAVEVEIDDPDLCPRYSASLIRGVRIGPSPPWMQRRLRAAGMRPINNIVDVTNYVMLEWGQPLHAFDYQKVRGRRIIVRRAGKDKHFTTLDGEERELLPETLVIADGEGPVGIAGVMGGLESEVTEETRDVLLESANFDRGSIRRTSQALKVRTEASIRFDKGMDPESTIPALARASELIRQLAGGEVAQGFADLFPRPPQGVEITLPMGEIERLLGMRVPPEEARTILESLDFKCQLSGEDNLRVYVPSYRGDVTLPADLVEEVARIKGYDEIPTVMISGDLPPQARNWDLYWERQAKEVLAACGLQEVITYSLVREGDLDGEPHLSVANPIVAEENALRTTLLPTLLQTVAANLHHQPYVAIFEIGRVYLPQEGDLPKERRRLALAMVGSRRDSPWSGEERAIDFSDLRGVLEALLPRMGIEEFRFDMGEDTPWLHPQRQMALLLGGEEEPMGILGELHPQKAERYDLGKRALYLAELDFEALSRTARAERRYEPLPRFPAITEDMAFVVDEEVPAEKVRQSISKAGGNLLAEVRLFDLYRGQPIPPGWKSLAYSLTFRAPDRTLTDKEVVALKERIRKHLERELGARLRE